MPVQAKYGSAGEALICVIQEWWMVPSPACNCDALSLFKPSGGGRCASEAARLYRSYLYMYNAELQLQLQLQPQPQPQPQPQLRPPVACPAGW